MTCFRIVGFSQELISTATCWWRFMIKSYDCVWFTGSGGNRRSFHQFSSCGIFWKNENFLSFFIAVKTISWNNLRRRISQKIWEKFARLLMDFQIATSIIKYSLRKIIRWKIWRVVEPFSVHKVNNFGRVLSQKLKHLSKISSLWDLSLTEQIMF